MVQVGFEYAGFWRRFGAVIIDGIFLGLISMLFKILALNSLGLDFLLAVLYTSFFESSELQGTPGKAFLDMRVISLDGQRISFKKALIRYAVRLLSGFLMGFGFLMMLFTEKKQTLHDLAAETLVVRGEVKNVNYIQAWYQQFLHVLGLVDQVPEKKSVSSVPAMEKDISPVDLVELYEQYKAGHMSEEEYQKQRAELLKKF